MDRKKLANHVSQLINPLLLSLVTFIPLVNKYGNGNTARLFGITSIFGSILPLIMVFYMVRKGIISDFYAPDRRERFVPFVGSIICYIAGTVTLIAINAPSPIIAVMACYVVNGVILSIITLRWKISIHTSGVTSPVTALVYLLGTRMLPLFMLFIPVAWARLELKAHSTMQVTMGALLSAMLTWIQMAVYVNYVFV